MGIKSTKLCSKAVSGIQPQKNWIKSFEQLLKFGNIVNSVPLRFDGKVQVMNI